MERNESLGISPKTPHPFNSLLDFGVVTEKALIEHHVRFRPRSKMKQYILE